MGYVANFPKHTRKLPALCFLLAKMEVALLWGSKRIPTLSGWLNSLVFCNTNSEVYSSLLPRLARPKNIWDPLKNYLASIHQNNTTRIDRGIEPSGIG